jgi:predicted Zn-dependent protease
MEKSGFFLHVTGYLAKLKNSSSGIIGWEFIESKKRSVQKLFSGDEEKILSCHQERDVDELSYYLTLYTNFFETGYIGIGSSDILPFMDVEEQVNRVIDLSKNSRNKEWKLAEKPEEEYPVVITCDPKIKEDPESVMLDIEREALDAIRGSDGIYVNSSEIYVNYKSVLRETGTGIVTFNERSDIYFEIAMEEAGSVNDKEVHEKLESVSRKDLDVTSFINECALQVKSFGKTVEPDTDQNAVIVVNEEVISVFLSSLVNHLDCAYEYMNLPFLKENDKVHTGEKKQGSDRLNITLDPFIPEMTLSSGFTQEGLVSKKMNVIKDDVVCCQIINNRFGSYLNRKPNGITGNIVVPPGNVKDFKGISDEFIEIIKFSSLLIDEKKHTWSSEIKLAKKYNGDGSVALLKGGVVSGKISENLSDMYFSKQTAVINSPGSSWDTPKGYIGPKKMMIKRGVSIVGKS